MIKLKIKEIAEKKKFTQGKLARAADVDNKTISRIYRNPYIIVNTETLDKIARALGVDASVLIESEPSLPRSIVENE